MPSQSEHETAAKSNRAAIVVLRADCSTCCAPWIVIVAFYAAMHVVEAVLASQNLHSENHEGRHETLKRNRRYQHLYKHYKPLFDAAWRARYEAPNALDNALLAGTQFVDHYLNQIEHSAARLLNDPDFVQRVRGD